MTDERAVPAMVVWIGAALVAVPFVVAGLSMIGAHWNPVGDQAVEVLRIRDVGTAHTPLLGQWSRWGWAHPGPLTFWLLAPFSRLLGNDGVLLGTALLNLVAAVGVVFAAARIAPAAAVLAGTATGLLAHAAGLDFLVALWNPWAAFFPFVLFLVVVWVVCAGHHRWIVGAVAVGSFVLQSHTGYAALVVGLLALAAVGPVWTATRRRAAPVGPLDADPADTDPADADPARRRARRALGAALLVGVVLWLPPLIQQVTDHPGNLSEIARYARGDVPTAGWKLAIGTMGTQIRPNGPWLTDDEQNAVGFERQESTWVALVTLAATAGLGALAFRRGRRDAAHLAVVALSAVGLGLVSTARVTGVLLPYVIGFWRPIVAITYLSIAWSTLSLVATRAAWRVSTAAALGVLAALAVVAIVDAPAAPPLPNLSRAIGGVGPATAAAIRHDARYLVDGRDPATLDAGQAGLILYLEQRGYRVFDARSPTASLIFGDFRLATPETVDGHIILASRAAIREGWRPGNGARVIAGFDPLRRYQRARADALETRIRRDAGVSASTLLPLDARIQRARAVDAGARRADVDELARLQAHGDAYVVYLTAP